MKKLTLVVITISLFILGSCTVLGTQVRMQRSQAKNFYADEAQRSPDIDTEIYIPKEKTTTLGLYLTAKEAYERWLADPDNINIIDCRTPQEYAFVGHAPMAYNIPFKFMEYEWNPEKKSYAMTKNPAFVEMVKEKFQTDATIFIMCRSGGRSAECVNELSESGFTHVYTIIDGFEGDMIKNASSYYNGKRMKNGWKNSNAPWTYEMNPELIYIPENKEIIE